MEKRIALSTGELIAEMIKHNMLDENNCLIMSRRVQSSVNYDVYRIICDPYDDDERWLIGRIIVRYENGKITRVFNAKH